MNVPYLTLNARSRQITSEEIREVYEAEINDKRGVLVEIHGGES